MSSGQTINDRILAARFSIAGQGLAKSVCKATTEEVNGPKKKHLDYLLHCTNEPNVSIPQLANLLIERSQNTSWVVVFKALVTVHHLMCYGNERFTQYLASSNCNFQLGNFLDKSGVAAPGGYDMSPFIRRYAKYLNEKALAYRTVAFDFCKVKRGKEDGTLRTMQTDKLLKTLPVLQSHLDALLEFDCSSNELTNGVINTAFMLLFRDLIRLFACYNDGIINLLEKYFDMNKKQCREALDIYKRFLVRMDRVAEFLKVAETVGVEKSDIPELSKAPSSLLEALEAHLASLEGKKPNSSSTTNVSAVGGANGEAAPGIDENLKRQALAEEEAAMSQFKKNTNPFLSSPTTSNPPAQAPTSSQTQTQSIVDLFAADIDAKAAQTNAPRTSDDLLQLAANPFAAPPIPPLPTVSAPATAWGMNPMQNGYGAAPSGAFATDNAFAAAFGVPASSTTNGFDAFGDLLQPNINGNVTATVKPNVAAVPANTAAASRVLTGDLDSCLANLADNLTIQKSPQNIPANKGMQWSNAGAGLPRQPIPNQGPSPQPQQWGAPMMPAQMGVSTGMPFMSMNQPTMPYQTAPMNMNMNMMGSVPMRPSQMMASQGGMMFPTQQPPQAMGMPAQIRPAATSTQALDPFGAL